MWIAGQVGRHLLLLWIASLASFAIVRAMPADPAVLTLLAFNQPVTPETIALLHAQWGLDRPLIGQYAAWVAGFFAGDWHVSFKTGEPVVTEFIARLPVSLTIGCLGLVIALALAVMLGEAAARRPHGFADHVLNTVTLGAQAVPAFWIACLLIWLFAVELRWLRPLGGADWTRYVMPIGVVALSGLGPLASVYRAGLLEVGRSGYFTAARAKGLDAEAALLSHGRRYAALGLASALTAEAGWVVGGTAVVEVVFGLPGISQFLIDSLALRDYFVLQAYLMVAVAWMIAIAFTAQLVRHALDPRRQFG
jgi:peptide/nickel transport system permease protein